MSEAKKFAIAVLLVLGLIYASVSSGYTSSSGDLSFTRWTNADTTRDTTDSGGPIPPIGH